MVRGLTTKPTSVGSDRIYLGKAGEFLEGARLLKEARRWNASAVLSVHAVISACDALCARFLQMRHAGADHQQAIELLGSLPLNKGEIDTKLKQARRVISMKNAAEYEDRLVGRGDAQKMLKDAVRFVEWVEEKFV